MNQEGEEIKNEMNYIPFEIDGKINEKKYKIEELDSEFHETLVLIKNIMKELEIVISKTTHESDLIIVKNLINIITILINQYELIIEIHDLKIHSQEDLIPLNRIQELSLKYENLSEFNIKFDQNSTLCLPMLRICDPFIRNNLMSKLQKKINKLLNIPLIKQNNRSLFIKKFVVYETKTRCVAEFLPYIALYSIDDIFCKPKTDPEWIELYKYYQEHELTSERNMDKGIQSFGKMLDVVNAVYSSDKNRKSRCCNGFKMCMDAIYYFFSTKKAKFEANLFYANPDPKTAISVWNVPDKTFVKKFMKITNPCIKYKKRFYVERTVPSITLASILEEYEQGSINSKGTPQKQDFIELEKKSDQIFMNSASNSIKSLFKRDKNKDCIKIRVLSHIKLSLPKNKATISDVLFIHIHGGGFISMSSNSHQCYTRLFSKIGRFPVFSIDYRLAPENPYPLGFDDVWQAYNWLLNNCSNYFGIEPKHVFLSGDSAGGNLSAAITIACIKKGIRIPDGLFLMYPAMNTNNKGFSPSYLKAFDDVVLQHSFLKLCLSSYVADSRLRPDIDPYLSPINTSDEILNLFPPIQIISGGRDPLSDDSVRFVQKMIKLKKDIKMKLYKGLPHGFMNYDYVGGLAPASLAIQDACLLLRNFVNSVKEKKFNNVAIDIKI